MLKLPLASEPWPVAVLRVIVLLGKVMAVILCFMIALWSWPRFRFDQLMALAWKVMLPLGVVNLVVVAVWTEYGEALTGRFGPAALGATAAVGWGTLVVSWFVVAVTSPDTCDNTPRRGESDVSLPPPGRVDGDGYGADDPDADDADFDLDREMLGPEP